MQRQTLYNLHKTAFLPVVLFVFNSNETGSNKIPILQKSAFLAYGEFDFSVDFFIFFRFWKHEMHLYETLSYVDDRAFHAASFGLFCFC